MELRQLKYFLAVAEELHFGNAARRMNISQPPLSQQVKQLEEELGARLFERTSRSVALTPEGVFFKEEAKAILERLERAGDTVRAMARGEEGSLSIGFVVIINQSLLPEVILDYKQRFPKVHLELKEMTTNYQLKSVRNGTLDIGFIRYHNQDLSGLCKKTYIKENYVLALSDRHPLAGRTEISLGELTDEPLVMFKRDNLPALYDEIVRAFTRAGMRPRMVQETNRRLTAIALVAAGMGVSPVPESTRRLGREGVTYLPIVEPLPEIEVAAVWADKGGVSVLDSFVAVMESHRRRG
ncbi:LysR family transcriptional regulator [Desulfoluna spongiiphila]|uniref:Transcriptional regulator, LysR family n=1 Tax=Desulfoluna spongiiphila TaxID=419481 RepID=A0A1G5HD47_9BACT|nr:LysR family transcriptional regulator [Desulfoluna spongiiphila]SCY61617.1 transcriptional regulator, LysR family [Desulfoluna spongiiphila]